MDLLQRGASALLALLAPVALEDAAHAQCLGDLLLTVDDGGQGLAVRFDRSGNELARTSGTPAGAGYLSEGLFLPSGDFLCLSVDGMEFFDGETGVHQHSVALPAEPYPAYLDPLQDGTVVVKSLLSLDAKVYDLNGGLLAVCGGLDVCAAGPDWSLGVDSQGHVWVTESCGPYRMKEFDATGNLLSQWDVSTYNGVQALEGAPDGTLWFLGGGTPEAANHDTAGNLLGAFPAAGARSLAVDADGSLWLAGTTGVVSHHAPDGSLLEQFSVPASWKVWHVDIERAHRLVSASYCGPAALNSTGASATLRASGCQEAELNVLELQAAALPPGEPGYFLVSRTKGFVPFAGGSQGHLCLGGAVGRYSSDPWVASPGGEAQRRIDMTTVPTPDGTTGVLPGETWHWQGWFRDHNPGPTSNMTDGLSVTFD